MVETRNNANDISGAAAPRAPGHVAIIMDGNGRWAERRGMKRLKGHEAGAEAVRAALAAAHDLGIRYLTLYAFSVENWRRPAEEVAGLMKLLGRFLGEHVKELHKYRTRLRVQGRRSDLPFPVRKALTVAEADTEKYGERTLILALSYGGRAELTDAVRGLAREVERGELRAEEITSETLGRSLYLPDVPDPDLIIRTGGEQRLSNFLLWQCAYSELYFTTAFWPDFREEHLAEALSAYNERRRRFGGLGEVSEANKENDVKT